MVEPSDTVGLAEPKLEQTPAPLLAASFALFPQIISAFLLQVFPSVQDSESDPPHGENR